jgi:26S proteasome regulatory subunit T2
MGNAPGGMGGKPPGGGKDDKKKKEEAKKRKFEPTTRVGRRRRKGLPAVARLPKVYPTAKCKLRLMKMDRIKDFLLLEQEYIQNQEALRPSEGKDKAERDKVEELRGTPMSVGSLEEMMDDSHAIVSSSTGPEYYVNILSFVDKDTLEPGSSVLLHNKTMSVVGILTDEQNPMVSMMKVRRRRGGRAAAGRRRGPTRPSQRRAQRGFFRTCSSRSRWWASRGCSPCCSVAARRGRGARLH